MTVSSPVPDAGTPIFDASGYIHPVWHLFFQTLLRRTGGTDGIDAAEESERINRLAALLAGQQAMQESLVPVVPLPPEQQHSGFAPNHGVHYDPDLHALATIETAGFMSPEDKIKLANVASYEAGSWTPAVSFDTPGDLAVAYSARGGTYTKIGSQVTASCYLITSLFTYTTAIGYLMVSGLPFANLGAMQFVAALNYEGINKLGYTQFSAIFQPATEIVRFVANSPGMVSSLVDNTNTTSGSNIALVFTISYFVSP